MTGHDLKNKLTAWRCLVQNFPCFFLLLLWRGRRKWWESSDVLL